MAQGSVDGELILKSTLSFPDQFEDFLCSLGLVQHDLFETADG